MAQARDLLIRPLVAFHPSSSIAVEAILRRPSSPRSCSKDTAMADGGATTQIQPPPGLDVDYKDESEFPKPRIAYSKDNNAQPPLPSVVNIHQPASLGQWHSEQQNEHSSKGDSGSDSSDGGLRVTRKGRASSGSSSGEGPPTVRFCVYCGTQVPPKLIMAKFCVYCGQAHGGQPGDMSQELSPQTWSPYYSGDVDGLYRSVAEKAMVYQSLMAAMVNPMGQMDPRCGDITAESDYYMPGQWPGCADWTEWQS
uniref:Uncharacterized protein n=1 Tax=Alexandrium catenella TaxID=2925 RepID=A0A7S1MLC5_ALECA